MLFDADIFVRAARAGNYIEQKTYLDVFDYHSSFKRFLKKKGFSFPNNTYSDIYTTFWFVSIRLGNC